MNELKKKVILDIEDKPTPVQWLSLSIQHLFAMFGATVLVPFLVGIDPAVALISSGIATLVFILITRGKAPSYLGSSFAFIAPMAAGIKDLSPGETMVGVAAVGVVISLVALLIGAVGPEALNKVLPPVVVAPIIMVIGLGLASTAVDMAMKDNGAFSMKFAMVSFVTLAITIIASVFGKGFVKIIPILIGIAGGYIFAATQGLVHFQSVIDAKWFAVPNFIVPFVDYTPKFNLSIISAMILASIVVIAEHIGHQLVLGRVVGRDMLKEPGLRSSMLGDGVATFIAGCIGACPTTTYGENIGVLAITRVYSIYVFVGAAVAAITFGFVGKISALINSIPVPVMGGVSILLFGIIASSGLRMLVEEKVNLEENRNLIISSVILVLGIGGALLDFKIGSQHLSLEGMALAAVVGIILNLVLPKSKNETLEVTSEKDIVA